MSSLRIFADDGAQAPKQATHDPAVIAAELGARGVRFERWDVRPLPSDADQEAVLVAYAPQVARIQAEGGYATADVIRLTPDHPQRVAIRAKFLAEHTHAEDEVRFFVEGRGLFSLHLGDEVCQVRCEAGDLLSVPAGTPHWFDTGEAPHVTAIRVFTNPAGWVAEYTGAAIAADFPTLET